MSAEQLRRGVTLAGFDQQMFDRVTSWWSSAMAPGLASNTRPVEFLPEGGLRVVCSSDAWATLLRMLTPLILKRLEGNRPESVPKVDALAIVKPPQVPKEAIASWSTLVGADLAGQIRPSRLSRWGTELHTIAETTQARDLFERRLPVVLTRLRALLPETPINRILPSELRPVRVLIVASPRFTDREAVDEALLDTWHDAAELFGPEHPVWISHAGKALVGQIVEEWAVHTNPHSKDSPQIDTFRYPADLDSKDAAVVTRRDKWLTSKRFDLCLVFAAEPDEDLPLITSVQSSGVPIRKIVVNSNSQVALGGGAAHPAG